MCGQPQGMRNLASGECKRRESECFAWAFLRILTDFPTPTEELNTPIRHFLRLAKRKESW